MRNVTTFDFSGARDMTYIRKVYTWLALGAGLSASTAWLSLNVGDAVYTKITPEFSTMAPPAVVAICDHPVFAMLLFLTLAFATVVARGRSGASAPYYFLFTAFSGAFIGPALFIAQWKAAHYHTLSAHPIRDSFFMTAAMFFGLTTYAWTTKRDFSWLAGSLYTGLWVIIGAGLLNIFLGSTVFELAIDSVAVLLFGGYILFDTQTVLKKIGRDDAIGDALNLYLDILNIFLSLLNISSSKKD